jgi:GDPmannose 4,6-dehydratase
LGNLDTLVDVGCARAYMEAAHAILQLDEPGEFVIASGQSLPIATLVHMAFARAGIRENPLNRFVVRDPHYYQGTPSPSMQGDTRRIRAAGIDPRCNVAELIARLVKHAEGETA